MAALTRQQTDAYPILQQETAAHHAASSVAAILNILTQAEHGDLIAQSELFADMEERDAHIYAEMTKRRMAIAQLDWDLTPAASAGAREKKTVQALGDRIRDELDLESLLFDLTGAIGHGFACIEMEWTKASDGLWLPTTFHARPQRWFTVDKATRRGIRLRDWSLDGAELQRWGWIVHQPSAKTGEPATRGLFRVLALPYLFKNFATKNWLRFCELYAVPMRVLFTMESDPVKKAELMYALQTIGQNGAAVLTGGKANEDLQTVNAATGEGQGFEALINWCERSVSKAILGGTLTSQADGKTSTNALGKVHDDVRLQIRDHDARQLADTLTTYLIGAILQVNRLPYTAVWRFDTQEPEDLTLYADALPKLAAIGMRIPEAWARDKLKIPEPEGDEAILAPQQQTPPAAPPTGRLPSPAEQRSLSPAEGQATGLAGLAYTPVRSLSGVEVIPDQAAIDDGINTLANADAQNQAMAEALLGPVVDLIQNATTYQEVMSKLAAQYPDMRTTQLEDRLARALFAADVWGQVNSGEK